MDKNSKTYFLAANSAEGFVSHFGDCYDEYDGWRVYIIKGGPGSGKSSLMKKIASRARIKGLDVTVCPCSSDPDSLDGVVIEDIKTVILDGTAPHTLEPKLAGVCENIINLCDNWDAEILYNNCPAAIYYAFYENKSADNDSEEIIELFRLYYECHTDDSDKNTCSESAAEAVRTVVCNKSYQIEYSVSRHKRTYNNEQNIGSGITIDYHKYSEDKLNYRLEYQRYFCLVFRFVYHNGYILSCFHTVFSCYPIFVCLL